MRTERCQRASERGGPPATCGPIVVTKLKQVAYANQLRGTILPQPIDIAVKVPLYGAGYEMQPISEATPR